MDKNVYDEKHSFMFSLFLAFQHIFAAFNGIVAVPLIVGSALSLDFKYISFYVSCAIFSAGLATFLQAKVFAKMPVVMGTDFTFVGPSLSVGKEFGFAYIFSSTIVGSFLEIILSRFIPFLKKLFPPLVTSIVISLIGLTLIPVSIDWIAGGTGSPDYASISNILLAISVIAFILIIRSFGKRLENISVFSGIVFGYILAYFMGKLDLSGISSTKWISIPEPLYFGWKFNFSALPPFLIAYIVTTIETIGDLSAIGRVSDKPTTKEELSRGILGDGIGSLLGGFFNAGANTSFSQNVGIIPITKVKSRHVVALAGIVLILMGIFPKIGAIIAAMPQPVLGGAGLIMFGAIAASGLMGLKEVENSSRNIIIIALSLGTGIGVIVRPEILSHFPQWIKILLSSGITTGTIVAITLNLILKK